MAGRNAGHFVYYEYAALCDGARKWKSNDDYGKFVRRNDATH